MTYDSYRPPMAVILADGMNARLGPMTDSTAACMLSVGGSVILERMIRNCLSCGISRFVLVLGHRADDITQFVTKAFRGVRVTYVTNDRYRDSNTAHALSLAAAAIGSSEFIRIDANVVFDAKILRQFTDSDLPNALCIDRKSADGKMKVVADDQNHVRALGKSVDPETAQGVSIGIEKISAKTAPLLFAEIALMTENAANLNIDLEAAYGQLIEKGTDIYAFDVTGLNWTNIETTEDFDTANAIFRSPITTVSRGQQRALDEASEDGPGPT
ncbi:phosphocholine cytidylyltransferase family protein [Tateyamaria pelophila]|uniref:phosphocholine cytidylyltransferase family protein n=1 Tax=Tateyamaria pelophila TaxID=328415 RepID=UPI001CBB5ED6|nr:sugar phosphate nucleotidyltransferase [Tateyamaria pelophila]